MLLFLKCSEIRNKVIVTGQVLVPSLNTLVCEYIYIYIYIWGGMCVCVCVCVCVRAGV